MKASSVQRTESEERWWKGCSRMCSMESLLDSSYRRTEQFPDCEAPTMAHCGEVWSQASPRIGWLSTSMACVSSSRSWSTTATTPSFLPISMVLRRIGWNSNWRTPLLQWSSRFSCGTCSSRGRSSSACVPRRAPSAASRAVSGVPANAAGSRSKRITEHRPSTTSVISQPVRGRIFASRRQRRSPCVHLRSSERRVPGSTASIIAVGLSMLAG
mmetsp:Transcript_6826/g.18369  ORF Transcript_6826/g.18369 Transcript_6826/m.18369 type:complete len:214 (-) Transcript_6826:180-821(-)